MTEQAPSTPPETTEHELSAEELTEAQQDLGSEAVEQTVEVSTKTSGESSVEKISSTETAKMIDDYKAEHGSVQGLSMKELVEKGFDPDMTLLKLGGERLEEKLDVVNVRYRAERGTEAWKRMEDVEARYIPLAYGEIDALMDAGANPQNIVDALQRTQPEDGVDNPNSVQIVERLDRLVDAGLPPAIIAARLNPSWREAVKDKLAAAEVRWHEANHRKAVTK